jgi:hypothetical protein
MTIFMDAIKTESLNALTPADEILKRFSTVTRSSEARYSVHFCPISSLALKPKILITFGLT